jgi:inorganic triphosphatase YgiF
MNAMVFTDPWRPLAITEMVAPQPNEQRVLIRVAACAVCRTDLHIVDGELTDPKLPLIPGHEKWEHKIGGPQPDLERAQGTALEPLLNGHVQDSLRPMFETRIRRTTYRLARHEARVEIALDQGEVDTGERRGPVCELEFELMRGEPAELFRLARTLSRVAPLRLAVRAKADRGYAVEFFADVVPGKKHAKQCKGALASLKNLQDALGGLNDIATREKLASRVAVSTRHTSMLRARELAFAAGMIAGSQEAHVDPLLEAADRAYAKLRDVKPFWT